MKTKRRIVVAGAGSIGRRHARLLAGRKDLSVELCDPDPMALSEAIEDIGAVAGHKSYEGMLETHPDIVLIASPHDLHPEQTISALEAGAHVLCEKPMADRLENARRVKGIALSTDRVLVYGFSNHFHPGILRTKDIMDSGRLGEIMYMHFHIGTYGTLVHSRSHHQADTEAALLMDYVHQPDLLYWMLGKNPLGVYASGSMGGSMELMSNPNSMTLLLDYDAALTASIHLNYIQYPDRYHYEVVGDKGWVYYDLMSNTLYRGDGNREKVFKEELDFDRDALFEAEHQAFFDAIAGKRSPESSAEDAIQSMIVLEAAVKSWKMRKRIACGPS